MKNGKETKDSEKINLLKLNTTATRVVYWVFEAIILATMIASIVLCCIADSRAERATQVNHIMLCVVALLLYNIPSLVQWKFKVYVPSAIHIFVLIFICAHFVLGEVVGVYTTSAVFDKILHATSGLAIALCGFSVVNLLNSNSNSTFKLNPFFVAFFSFCFALAIALLWEIFEFAADSLFGMNMQRWDPPEEIKQAVESGVMKVPKQGYGLVDTMQDVIVSTASAFVVCLGGFIILRRKQTLLNRFLMRKISDYDTAIMEAEEAGDDRLCAALRKAKSDALEQIEAGNHGVPPEPEQEKAAAEETENNAAAATEETEVAAAEEKAEETENSEER